MPLAPHALPLPPGCPARFLVTAHGTVFAGREVHLQALREGDRLLLAAGSPGSCHPEVWIHREDGELLGHVPPAVAEWLAPWLAGGGKAVGRVVRIRGEEAPSYRRLVMEVICGEG